MDSILNPLYSIVSGVMVAIHQVVAPIFGKDSGVTWTLSIMGLVVLIRIILIPLFVKQIKSQRAMTALQPHMKEIQKKFKDDRQKQSEEMMKLYKEHKTNPLASCFPIIAQAPIFFALFTVLNGIAAKTDEGVAAPIGRGFLKCGASYIFWGKDFTELPWICRSQCSYRHRNFNYLYVGHDIYYSTSIDG
jgi:YidC/Oxa1 family membrane protein insertase